jgi:hypothetical protein
LPSAPGSAVVSTIGASSRRSISWPSRSGMKTRFRSTWNTPDITSLTTLKFRLLDCDTVPRSLIGTSVTPISCCGIHQRGLRGR